MFATMKTRTKILVTFGAVMGVSCVVGFVAHWSIRLISKGFQETVEVKLPSAIAVGALRTAMYEAAAALNTFHIPTLDAYPDLRWAALDVIDKAVQEANQAIKDFDGLARDQKTDAAWKEFKDLYDQWRAEVDASLTPMREKRRLVGQGLALDSKEVRDQESFAFQPWLRQRYLLRDAQPALEQLITRVQTDVAEEKKKTQRAAELAASAMAAALAVGALLLLAMGLLLARSLSAVIRRLIGESSRLRQAVANGQLDVRCDIQRIHPEFQPIVAGMNETMDALAEPLRFSRDGVLLLAEGRSPPRIEQQYRGDFEAMKQAWNQLIAVTEVRSADTEMLVQAALEGRLDVRADVAKYSGQNGILIAKMNDMLDGVVRPLRTAADCVRRISRGDIPQRIAESWPGDFSELKESLNLCIDSLSGLVADISRMAAEQAAGDSDAAIDEKRFEGTYRALAAGVNGGIRMYVSILKEILSIADAYAHGDFEPVLRKLPGKQEQANLALDRLRENLRSFSGDVQRLSQEAIRGQLAARADASRYQGDWQKLVQGVNGTLDAVVEPLDLAARYVDDIARGRIPPRIEESWPGDFDKLKNNLNQCIAAVNALVEDANRLSRAAVEGQLTIRADASKHQGDYRKVIEGVNRTLDAVIGPLQMAASYMERISKGDIPENISEQYRGDFNAIKESLNRCVTAISILVEEVGVVIHAGQEGHLSQRANADRAEGAYRKILRDVNETLDAMLAPVHEAAQVLEKLAQRDLRARMSGSYRGDHADIKKSLNATAEALHEALAQVAESADQLSSAAGQIASSSHAVASGASQQAASLEETSSSLVSMASMTKQSADNAQQANALAQTAKGAAAEGTTAMGHMQSAMDKIRTSAEGTSQIIRNINDIAFQTNLLALNAAVEAARAGEAGRGFSVVAEEVRSLALRSKEAAMKTEELIRQSVKETEDGDATSQHVSAKLGEIAQAIGKVTDIVAEIAAAAREQATGIEQVTKAMSEMDKVTQQNAANSEESSSAAAELLGQSEQLTSMVATFHLDERSRPEAKRLDPARSPCAPASEGEHQSGGASQPSGAISPVPPPP